MHHAWEQGNPPTNIIKDASTIMCNPCLASYISYSGKGLHMIVLVSLIVLLKDFLVTTYFALCIPSLLFKRMVSALV